MNVRSKDKQLNHTHLRKQTSEQLALMSASWITPTAVQMHCQLFKENVWMFSLAPAVVESRTVVVLD